MMQMKDDQMSWEGIKVRFADIHDLLVATDDMG
jgi:hypothetical protein